MYLCIFSYRLSFYIYSLELEKYRHEFFPIQLKEKKSNDDITKLHQKLIANTHNCSYKLLSYKYWELFSETRSLFKTRRYASRKCHRRETPIRVVPPLLLSSSSSSSSHRRAWSKISDFSRARGWQIESPRTFARSEEDGKARKSRRAGLARGYREVKRYRESQPVRERKRVEGLDVGLGDVREYRGI